MMMHRIFLIALAIVVLPLSAPLAAQAQSLEGRWDMQIGETVIFRFDITEGDDGEWHGVWSRPESFASDGNSIGRVRGAVEQVESMTGIEFLDMVELSFEDPRPGAIPDIFRFELVSDDAVKMTYVGTDLEPYSLARADEDAVIGNWNPDRIYVRRLPSSTPDNPFRLAPSAQPSLQRQTAPAPPVVEAEAEELVAEEKDAEEQDAAEPAAEEAEAREPEDDEQPRIGADFLNDL